MFSRNCSICCLDVSLSLSDEEGTQFSLARLTFPGTSDDGRQEKRKWMKDRLGTGLSDSTKVTTEPTCTQTSAVIRIVSLSAALMDCDLSEAT